MYVLHAHIYKHTRSMTRIPYTSSENVLHIFPIFNKIKFSCIYACGIIMSSSDSGVDQSAQKPPRKIFAKIEQ